MSIIVLSLLLLLTLNSIEAKGKLNAKKSGTNNDLKKVLLAQKEKQKMRRNEQKALLKQYVHGNLTGQERRIKRVEDEEGELQVFFLGLDIAFQFLLKCFLVLEG